MQRRVVRVVVVIVGTSLAALWWGAGAAAAEPRPPVSELRPAPWPIAEVLGRCRAVIETATADYEGIVATFDSATNEALQWRMQSDAPMPLAEYEAKLCSWVDVDGDQRIDAAEESSVTAFVGPLDWTVGTTNSVVRVGAISPGGRVCSRLWIYANYPDGRRSTKRSSIACTDGAAVEPSPVVPEAPRVVLLGGSALALLGAAAWWLPGRRRPS